MEKGADNLATPGTWWVLQLPCIGVISLDQVHSLRILTAVCITFSTIMLVAWPAIIGSILSASITNQQQLAPNTATLPTYTADASPAAGYFLHFGALVCFIVAHVVVRVLVCRVTGSRGCCSCQCGPPQAGTVHGYAGTMPQGQPQQFYVDPATGAHYAVPTSHAYASPVVVMSPLMAASGGGGGGGASGGGGGAGTGAHPAAAEVTVGGGGGYGHAAVAGASTPRLA